jgi:hypothetical protein
MSYRMRYDVGCAGNAQLHPAEICRCDRSLNSEGTTQGHRATRVIQLNSRLLFHINCKLCIELDMFVISFQLLRKIEELPLFSKKISFYYPPKSLLFLKTFASLISIIFPPELHKYEIRNNARRVRPVA